MVTPVVEHWLEWEIGPPHEGSIWRPITPWANALTTELRFLLCLIQNQDLRKWSTMDTHIIFHWNRRPLFGGDRYRTALNWNQPFTWLRVSALERQSASKNKKYIYFIVVCVYFQTYYHLRFKDIVLATRRSCLGLWSNRVLKNLLSLKVQGHCPGHSPQLPRTVK